MRDSCEFAAKYLLNSAVLVEYGEKKLLVDGIISDRQNFDMMDGRLEHNLMNGEGEFKGLSCVLLPIATATISATVRPENFSKRIGG